MVQYLILQQLQRIRSASVKLEREALKSREWRVQDVVN